MVIKMEIQVKDIYMLMDEFAPFRTAEGFDNCGLLVGELDAKIQKIGLALDATNPVIERAAEAGVHLLVTHHPVMFHPIQKIQKSHPVYRMIQYGISHIAAHTNLDKAEGGVNTVLARYYKLRNIASPLILGDLGRIGELAHPCSAAEYAAMIKESLGSGAVRYYDSGRPVKRVAYISGGGGSQFEEVLCCGIDTFITGDLKHDQFIEAENRGFNLIEANHFDSENTVMEPLAERIREAFPELEVVLLSRENPVKVV